MSLRPALVDPQGGPITGNGGGPMSLAKPAASWSHVTGKRQAEDSSVRGHQPVSASVRRGHDVGDRCIEVVTPHRSVEDGISFRYDVTRTIDDPVAPAFRGSPDG